MGKCTQIEIKTRLHDGIYKSEGGGQTKVVFSLPTGPRNLIRAIQVLKNVRWANTRAYGGIGCGKTWLEIAGKPVDPCDLEEIDRPENTGWHRREYPHCKFDTRTEKAGRFLGQFLEQSEDERISL